MRVSYPARGVVRTSANGIATVLGASRLVRWVDVAIAAGERPLVFHDWYDVTGYDPPVRRMLAAWYTRVFHDVQGVYILSSNKIVSMGVSLVSIAMGNVIVSLEGRLDLDVALAAAIRAAQRAS